MASTPIITRLKRPALLLLVAIFAFLAVDRAVGALLREGLDRYFGLDQLEAVLLVGHSHVVLGVDKNLLERELGLPVANYARAGAQLDDRILMARHYARLHPDGVRAIVFGVDNHLFTASGLSANSYSQFYPHMGDPLVGPMLRESAPGWDYRQRQISHLARYDDVLLNAAIRGWMGNWNNAVGGQFKPDVLAAEVASGDFRHISIDDTQVAQMEAFLDESEQKGWPVLLAFIPTTAQWQAVEPEKAAQVEALLRRLADAHANVTFIDLREPWQHREEFFIDPLHLNAEGSREVTADLSRKIAPLIPGAQDNTQ